jgi:hypothetical protein
MTKLVANPTMIVAALAANCREARQLTKLALSKGVSSLQRSQLTVIAKYGDDRYIRNESLLELMEIAVAEEDRLLWRDIGILLIDEVDDSKYSPRVHRAFAESDAPFEWMKTEIRHIAFRIERKRSTPLRPGASVLAKAA